MRIKNVLNGVLQHFLILWKKIHIESQINSEQSEKLDWSEISFPAELKMITMFEKQNSDMTVNGLSFEN